MGGGMSAAGREAMNQTNEYRRQHHACDLTWNRSAARHASSLAKKIARTETDHLCYHSSPLTMPPTIIPSTSRFRSPPMYSPSNPPPSLEQRLQRQNLQSAHPIPPNSSILKPRALQPEPTTQRGKLEHSGSKKFGENLAMGTTMDGKRAVDLWYGEVSKYSYGSNFQPGCGHFTALVWKGSTSMGVGKAKRRDGTEVVVANFFPAGNMQGAFKENVLPK